MPLGSHADLQGGVVTFEQALAAGVLPSDVGYLLRRGAWERVRRGIYAETTDTAETGDNAEARDTAETSDTPALWALQEGPMLAAARSRGLVLRLWRRETEESQVTAALRPCSISIYSGNPTKAVPC